MGKEASEIYNTPKDQIPVRMQQALNLFQPLSGLFRWTPGYEPVPGEDSMDALAAKEGKDPIAYTYDFLSEGGLIWKPQPGTYGGDMSFWYDRMQHPGVIPGFGDAGAHGTIIQDGVAATHSLTYFVRDRSSGPRMPIEVVVRKHTSDVAKLFGLHDRGIIAVGKKADL